MELIKKVDSKPNFNLQEYMEYTNENVLYRFSNMYNLPFEEIEDLFQETKKFLLISDRNIGKLYINDETLIIDEMWHNFILFTIDYEKFCFKFFGRFIHHTPLSKKEKEEFKLKRKNNPEKTYKEYLEQEEEIMSIVYDFYGPETVIKWFKHYPQKYTKDYIKSIMK